ncbi:MAG TPA: putative selenate reductase subunit YgfK [Clostridiaceae bacterium]|nr:putative selenate reductase subunit YgfK [Clostridiaceae bacterium]
MGDRMRPIPFHSLLEWMIREYREEGKVFGLQKNKFYMNRGGNLMETAFGAKLGSATGPAAGPQTQLAQNIVTSYLAGGRFIELKTVQKLDGEFMREAIAKPCINAEDEGYNVEWSTELTVEEARDEYIKAWILCHIAMKEFGISETRDFAFNMSVGYDLEGISGEKVNGFIEGLKDASSQQVFRGCLEYAKNFGTFERVSLEDLEGISPNICTTLSLSTLHGCPAAEIERIAGYLIDEKGMSVFIKCNPTLLGYDYVREVLDGLGYTYLSFDDHHFKEDLQFDEAVLLIGRLMERAKAKGLMFGVKLTNTFPVRAERKELPGEEMYMSGRSLLPLSIGVARKLAKAFDGKLPMAFSGGADALNIREILETGIQPVTVCTTLLKPGGFARLNQLAMNTVKLLKPKFEDIDVEKLEAFGEKLLRDERNHKDYREGVGTRKTEAFLPYTDCFKAPCKDGGCPIHQDIPEYLKLTGRGDFDTAFAVIAKDNPSPSILGEICSHPCQNLCTRVDYDKTIQIRDMKRIAAENGQEGYIANLLEKAVMSEKKVCVIGAGPAGMSAALFLRRNGMDVTVFEKEDLPYGQVQYLVPSFRISKEAVDRDTRLAEKQGVKFMFNSPEDYDLEELRKEYSYVVLATGPSLKKDVPGIFRGQEMVPAADLLRRAKEGTLEIQGSALVIGNGYAALETARLLKRTGGITQVVLMSEKGKDEGVPFEEKKTLMEEGIPVVQHVDDGLTFDVVIDAGAFRKRKDIRLKGQGTFETETPNVYAAGECVRGSYTMVRATADGKAVAIEILKKEGLEDDFREARLEMKPSDIYIAKGALRKSLKTKEEGNRCLRCHDICEICTEVCPNRANVAIDVEGFRDLHQIVHLDGMCNECGNCSFFCPWSGSPYKDKFTVFWTEQDFMDSKNSGILKSGEGYRVRDGQGLVTAFEGRPEGLEGPMGRIADALIDRYPHYLLQSAWKE